MNEEDANEHMARVMGMTDIFTKLRTYRREVEESADGMMKSVVFNDLVKVICLKNSG